MSFVWCYWLLMRPSHKKRAKIGNYFRNTKFQYSIFKNVKGSVFYAEPFTKTAYFLTQRTDIAVAQPIIGDHVYRSSRL